MSTSRPENESTLQKLRPAVNALFTGATIATVLYPIDVVQIRMQTGMPVKGMATKGWLLANYGQYFLDF